jgi:Ca2+-binding EF-hand superfamily protein
MEFDAHDANKDTKLDFGEFSALIREREGGEHTKAELEARFAAIDENMNNVIDLDEYIRFSLRDALQRSSTRVIDLFKEWDDDASGKIDLKEFRKAIVALGFDVPHAEIDAVFRQMDADGSGTLEYKELNKSLRSGAGSSLDPSLRPGAAGKIQTRADLLAKGKEKRSLLRTGRKGAALPPSVKLTAEDGRSIKEQLKAVLNEHSVRVIDLFRDWDDNGDGLVDKKEFRKAVAALGYSVPKADAEKVFDELDKDGNGTLSYVELNKALRRGADDLGLKLDPSMEAGAAGKIETRAELVAKGKAKREAVAAERASGSRRSGLTAQLSMHLPKSPLTGKKS